METINLSPAELELIKIKRQEEALLIERKNLERKADEEKRIREIESRINKDIENSKKFENELYALFTELTSFETKADYVWNDRIKSTTYEDYSFVDGKKNLFFSKIVELSNPFISESISKSTITAHEQFVTHGSYSYSRKESKGIKFKLDIPSEWTSKNDNLKSAKTINEKIEYVIAILQRNEKEKNIKESGISWLQSKVASKYPNAKIEVRKENGQFLSIGYGKTKFFEGKEFVAAIFPNNLELHFNFKQNGDNDFSLINTKIDHSKLSDENKELLFVTLSKLLF